MVKKLAITYLVFVIAVAILAEIVRTQQISKPDGTGVNLPSCTSNQRLTFDGSVFACNSSVIPHTHVTSDITDFTGSTSTYAIPVQALTSSPVDAQTIYFGFIPRAPTTTTATSKISFVRNGTITAASIYTFSGTAGTAESWSLYVRKGNTTDTLIQTLSLATAERVFTNSSLNIPVVAGDYVEIKSVNPTWVTNPVNTIFGGYLLVQ